MLNSNGGVGVRMPRPDNSMLEQGAHRYSIIRVPSTDEFNMHKNEIINQLFHVFQVSLPHSE